MKSVDQEILEYTDQSKVDPILKSANATKVSDHSNESHWDELLFDTVTTEQTFYLTDYESGHS